MTTYGDEVLKVMALDCYFMTLNQDEGSFTDGVVGFERAIAATRRGELYPETWRLGTNFHKIKVGDTIYIRRSSPKRKSHLPGGIIARGVITRACYESEWTRDADGKQIPVPKSNNPNLRPHRRVEFSLDSVLGLDQQPPDDFGSPQASGFAISPDVAVRLHAAWEDLFPRILLSHSKAGLMSDNRYEQSDENTRERERVLRNILERRGQPAFRRALIGAYGSRCAITGCNVQETIEAAHIVPCSENGRDELENGILLRADLHTLFDLDLFWIDPVERKVRLAPELKKSFYGTLEGRELKSLRAGKSQLEWRYQRRELRAAEARDWQDNQA